MNRFNFAKSQLIRLQQHLPFTVLKRAKITAPATTRPARLQQHLPFTVLKLHHTCRHHYQQATSCNSTYRLRY